jgi:NDP-sugar pyrophosphorylase family protein
VRAIIRCRGETLKAVILAGGEGTRLRPLTLRAPKPITPIVDRPLLQHQLEMLGRAGVHEVVFSLAYQPERIQAVFGDGSAWGKKIHYVVEESPLGTGGAVKNAAALLDDTTVVFNGDVLMDLNLAEVIAGHRRSGSKATIVLTSVENPSAYGLVETDPDGRVRRFIEKPKDPSQITTNNINAGIYILDTDTLGLMPPATRYSIERSFFPSLLERGDRVGAHVHRGYWIDIGTPEKYLQAHRDILADVFAVDVNAPRQSGGWIHPSARVGAGAVLTGPFYIGPRCDVEAGAVIGRGAVLTAGVRVRPEARVFDSVVWEGSVLEAGSQTAGALLANGVHVGAHAVVGPGAVLGEGTVVSDYSHTAATAV